MYKRVKFTVDFPSANEGKLVVKEHLVKKHLNTPKEEQTMKVLNEIAGTVYKSVQFTVDFFSLPI